MADALTQPHAHRPAVDDAPNRDRHFNWLPLEDALDKGAIAELSLIQISRMARDELIRVIRQSNLPLPRRDILGRLDGYDRETLEQMVFMARRCCRNQGY